MSLKVYTIHIKPSAGQGAGFDPDAILVPEGFSYYALLFQGFWALYHRLWLVALAMIILSFGADALAQWVFGDATITFAVNLGLAILIGAEARNLWRWTLERRGYRLAGVVLGETPEDADRRYFEKASSGKKYTILTGVSL